MFSVGGDSLSSVCILALVVSSGQSGVSASVVREEMRGLSSVVVRDQVVGNILRALERQGFIEQTGVGFVATKSGCERVDDVMEDMLRVSSGEKI